MGSHGLPITPHEVQESEHDRAKAAERDAGGATTGDEGAVGLRRHCAPWGVTAGVHVKGVPGSDSCELVDSLSRAGYGPW